LRASDNLRAVGFFEVPELDPPRPWRPSPPWFQAPEHELGIDVPFRSTVVHDADVWLGVVGITAYSDGFSVRIRFLRREGSIADVFQDAMSVRVRDSRVTDRFLRLGIEFADGRRATNLDEFAPDDGEDESDPVIAFRAHNQGSHGLRGSGIDAWIWPLPPSGPLTLAAEWPSVGLALTRVELPNDEIRAMAGRSAPLWDDDPEWRGIEE
jgi:hypothetical protein